MIKSTRHTITITLSPIILEALYATLVLKDELEAFMVTGASSVEIDFPLS